MASSKEIEYQIQSLEKKTTSETNKKISINVDEKAPKYLIQKAITIQNNNLWHRLASTKTRTEVCGGGKKPWKQKGTGRARSGSNTSPLWKGGGVVFGPKPRINRKKINSKERHLALTTALYNSKSKIKIVSDLLNYPNDISTKNFLKFIDKKLSKHSPKLTIVLHKPNPNLTLSTRNIPNLLVKYTNSITIKDIISSHSIFFTEEALQNFANNLTS